MEESPPVDTVVLSSPPEPKFLEINFHNPLAVRTGLMTALISSMVNSLPIPVPGWLLLSLTGAGFFAVFFYIRRTGQPMTVMGGARMGWITGLFSFMIATVFFTLTMVVVTNNGGFAAFYRETLKERMGNSADVEKLIELIQNPAALGGILAATLIFLFVLFTILPILGGALGAKMLARDRA